VFSLVATCLVWTGITVSNAGRYGWMWDPVLKRMDVVHRIVWRRVYGPIPNGPNGKPLEVDELGEISLCVRPDHLDLKTKRANVNKRGPTRGPNKRQ
jgi:HNH endonuclease